MTEFLSNLFNSSPGREMNYYIPLLVLSILIILFGIYFSIIYGKKRKTDISFKKLFKSTGRNFVLNGLLMLFLIMVRYENIMYFSMRIWLYLSVLLFVTLIGLLLKKYLVDYKKALTINNNKSKSEPTKTLYTTSKKRAK